jgi:rhamnosyltransferase
MNSTKATVFIPTWFGERYLTELLRNVFSQEVNFEYEVLIYDTSSTDRTQEIIKDFAEKHSNLRFKVITKEEFGHGRTRQAAAHDARGEIMVYLSQDATPADKHWLYEMVRPFDLNDKVMAVLGKQEPRAHAFPLLKGEIRAVFGSFGPDTGTTLFYKDNFAKNAAIRDSLSFYSDVNSATRRKFLLEKIPYQDVPYAEDQLFGRDIIEAGYIKAYAARGRVLHSNDIMLREYKHRMYDEVIGLRKTGFKVEKPSKKRMIKSVVLGAIKDSIRILRDNQYSWKRKIYWLVVNPFYHIQKWRGVTLAVNADINNDSVHEQHSFESKRHDKLSKR